MALSKHEWAYDLEGKADGNGTNAVDVELEDMELNARFYIKQSSHINKMVTLLLNEAAKFTQRAPDNNTGINSVGASKLNKVLSKINELQEKKSYCDALAWELNEEYQQTKASLIFNNIDMDESLDIEIMALKLKDKSLRNSIDFEGIERYSYQVFINPYDDDLDEDEIEEHVKDWWLEFEETKKEYVDNLHGEVHYTIKGMSE